MSKNHLPHTTVILSCFGIAILSLLSQVTYSSPVEQRNDDSGFFDGQSQAQIHQSVPQTLVNQTDSSTPKMMLLVDLSDRTVKVYRGYRFVTTYPIAVGKAGWETPTGTFEVREKILNPHWRHPLTGTVIPPGPQNPLGSAWIGFWFDGKNHIGFHGTYEANKIGQAVSHGCIRMNNPDLLSIYNEVQIGSLVIIQP